MSIVASARVLWQKNLAKAVVYEGTLTVALDRSGLRAVEVLRMCRAGPNHAADPQPCLNADLSATELWRKGGRARLLEESLLEDRQVGEVHDAVRVEISNRVCLEEEALHPC